MKKNIILTGMLALFCAFPIMLKAQINPGERKGLGAKEQGLIGVAALTAKGDLPELNTELNKALDGGLTVNQLKEVMMHVYAYAGFPRSLRGLQTLMAVLEERKASGITDALGVQASPVSQEGNKFDRGKAVLEKLTGVPETGTKKGYAAFAPEIEIFLKEHLFADLFERDVLTYAEREWVTISVLSSIGGVEPMLSSHLNICLKQGLTPAQLQEFIGIIKSTIGKKEAKAAQQVLNEVLKSQK